LGSGTTGIEALREGRNFWGCDINPVALLISKAKCRPINPPTLEQACHELSQKLSQFKPLGRRELSKADLHQINRTRSYGVSSDDQLDYWFPSAHRNLLECIFDAITNSHAGPIQTFFVCAFSNVLRGCSIWLSGSTKPQKDLDKTLADPIEAFNKQVHQMIQGNQAYWEELTQSGFDSKQFSRRIVLKREDAKHISLPNESLDLVVTSPPYATCYEYNDIHRLTELWLQHYNYLRPTDWVRSCIGSKTVSSRHQDVVSSFFQTGSTSANIALTKLANEKPNSEIRGPDHEVRALYYYFHDMQIVIRECARTLKPGKDLILIVGDSYKRGVTIPTSDALCELATGAGFELQERITRKIPARVLVSTRDRETGRFSSASESDMQAYPEENILVFTQKARKSVRKSKKNG
jgi:DNA modification methylase